MSLEYVNIDVDGRFKISPSGFNTFNSNPLAWYNTHVAKSKKFEGNTNTVVGTIIHGRIEKLWTYQPMDAPEELEYVKRYDSVAEVDGWKVIEDVNRLWEVIPDAIKHLGNPTHIEQQVRFDIPDSNFSIAGSYDYMNTTESILGDIKTSSTTPKAITIGHKVQLSLYEIALRANGTTNRKFQVIYIVKTKTPKVVIHTEDIDEEFILKVKNQVKTMIRRMDMLKEDPTLLDMLFFENIDSFIKA